MITDLKEFLGPFANNMTTQMSRGQANKGRLKRMIYDKTIKMLDEFYAPHNEALAELLGDDKWLFKRNIV